MTFTPSDQEQEVPAGVTIPPGCEVRLDQATGKAYARWPHGVAEVTTTTEQERAARKATIPDAATYAELMAAGMTQARALTTVLAFYEWIDRGTISYDAGWARAGDLHDAYVRWMANKSVPPVDVDVFLRLMTRAGYAPAGDGFEGLCLTGAA